MFRISVFEEIRAVFVEERTRNHGSYMGKSVEHMENPWAQGPCEIFQCDPRRLEVQKLGPGRYRIAWGPSARVSHAVVQKPPQH